MNGPGRVLLPLLVTLVGSGAGEDPAEPARPAVPRLEMTKAVVCSRVDGFEKYVPLAEPKLTSEDKLKVYFRPLNFKVEPIKGRYRAKFIEDGRVRRKGEKNALSKEDKLLEYEDTFDTPTYQIYLANTIGLKNLPPGDYEFDIVLHDALVEGSSTVQTVPFTIVPIAKDATSDGDAPNPPEKKAAAPKKKGKPARAARPKG